MGSAGDPFKESGARLPSHRNDESCCVSDEPENAWRFFRWLPGEHEGKPEGTLIGEGNFRPGRCSLYFFPFLTPLDT